VPIFGLVERFARLRGIRLDRRRSRVFVRLAARDANTNPPLRCTSIAYEARA
jgi:hypothetical protein